MKRFRLEYVCYTSIVYHYFGSIKSMNQYILRNKNYIKKFKKQILIDDTYQPFVCFGCAIVSLPELKKHIARLSDPLI